MTAISSLTCNKFSLCVQYWLNPNTDKEYICTRHMHLPMTPRPTPPYLGLSPKKPIFWDLPLNLKQSFQLRKIDALPSMHPAHFTCRDQCGVILSEGAARQNRSYGNQNLTHKVSDNLPLVSRKVVALCCL